MTGGWVEEWVGSMARLAKTLASWLSRADRRPGLRGPSRLDSLSAAYNLIDGDRGPACAATDPLLLGRSVLLARSLAAAQVFAQGLVPVINRIGQEAPRWVGKARADPLEPGRGVDNTWMAHGLGGVEQSPATVLATIRVLELDEHGLQLARSADGLEGRSRCQADVPVGIVQALEEQALAVGGPARRLGSEAGAEPEARIGSVEPFVERRTRWGQDGAIEGLADRRQQLEIVVVGQRLAEEGKGAHRVELDQ